MAALFNKLFVSCMMVVIYENMIQYTAFMDSAGFCWFLTPLILGDIINIIYAFTFVSFKASDRERLRQL